MRILSMRNRHVACILNQGKYGEAVDLMERALAIHLKNLGAAHSDTVVCAALLNNWRKKQVRPEGGCCVLVSKS